MAGDMFYLNVRSIGGNDMTPNAHLSAQEAQRQHGFSRGQRLLFALVSIIAPLMIFPASAWSADVCERYTDLANEAKAEYREEDALNFLRRATGACQNFESSYELGRLAASFGEDELNAEAAKAFTEAYDFASTSKEEAAAIGRYAELVFYTQGDPQRAMDYALQARALDPTTPWVSELVTTINERANILTAQDIQRSVLSDLALAPLRLKRNADVDESTPQDPQAVGGELARTINIPLNFVVGSTDLDLRTASNLDVLAGEISKPGMPTCAVQRQPTSACLKSVRKRSTTQW